MENEPKAVQFDEFATHLNTIFDEVEAGERSVTVERGGRLFTLRPKPRRRSGRKSRHFSLDDPLFEIIGIGHSEGATDVSSNKHKYIADAVASHWEQVSEATQAAAEDNTRAPDSQDTSPHSA